MNDAMAVTFTATSSLLLLQPDAGAQVVPRVRVDPVRRAAHASVHPRPQSAHEAPRQLALQAAHVPLHVGTIQDALRDGG